MVTKKKTTAGKAEPAKKAVIEKKAPAKTAVMAKKAPAKTAKITPQKPVIKPIATEKPVAVATPKVVTQAPRNENYWFMVLLYFASFLVGLGIIAMIAANWQQIPNNVKMLGALAAMAANAGLLIWTIKAGKNVLKQVVACVYAFLIMAVIGLIGQIFHLPTDVENGLLLWSLISWPLLFAAPRLLWLWIPLFYCGIHCFDLKTLWEYVFGGYFSSLLHRPAINVAPLGIWLDFGRNLCILALFTAYEMFMLKGNSSDKTIRRPLFFYSGLMMYFMYGRVVKAVYTIILIPTLPTMIKAGLFCAYVLSCVALGIVLFELNRRNNRRGFMPLFLVGTLAECLWVFAMVAGNINLPTLQADGVFNHYPAEMVCPLVFLLITTAYTTYHRVDFRDRFACYIALLVWFGVTFNENIFDLVPSLILCTVTAWLAYKENSRKWFNIAVMAAVIRILAYYADVSDLQHAGFYLIGSGLFIIVVILLLMKYGRLLWENRNAK